MEAATTRTISNYVRSKEAAEIIKKSDKWLETDRWTGPTIPYHKIGRIVVYRVDDLIAYVEAGRVPAIAE